MTFSQQSSKMATDGLRLWSTPIGKIRAPSGATSLPTIVAEQIRSVYGVGKQSVQAEELVIEGGANVGVF